MDIKNKHKESVIVTLLISLYSFPLIADLVINGWPRVFTYFAADAFFYTTVARYFSELGFFTFDGIFPTNGFHPLWQIMLGIFYQIVNYFNFSDPVILVSIFLFCVVIISVALLFLALAIKNYYGYMPSLVLILPFGIYPLIVAIWETRFGTLWSFTNGMETPVVILLFSILMYFLSKDTVVFNSRKHMILLGIINGLLTLSRLDHGLLSLILYGVIILNFIVQKRYEKIGYLLLSILTWLVIISFYVGVNKLSTGMWLPISGSLKSTFPNPAPFLDKIREIESLVRRYHTIDFGWWIWRYCQIIIPGIFAIPVAVLSIHKILKGHAQKENIIFGSLSIFVMLLALYNFTFVPIFDQGHWYFPVSILFMSLTFIHSFTRFRFPFSKWIISCLLLIFGLVFFVFIYWNPNHNELHRNFYLNASEVMDHFENSEIKMVEYDDGIITYSTRMTALSGFGFCLDNEAAEALRRGELLDLAYDRGYRYITSLYYFGDRFDKSTSSQEIQDYFSGRPRMIGQYNLLNYTFEVVFKSSDGNFTVIQMTKDRN